MNVDFLAAQQSNSALSATSQLPAENLYASLLSSGGIPINMLSQQIMSATEPAALLAAANLNPASALYPHSIFPWQLSPLKSSPPTSPISPEHENVDQLHETKMNNKNRYELNNNDMDMDFKSAKKIKQETRKMVNHKKRTVLFQTNDLMDEREISPMPLSPSTSGSPLSISPASHPSPTSTQTKPTKTFTCQTCNRSFGYKHVLQNHERTHTGEKPFVCGTCDKRFTRDHHLKTHMRLHTGEKPYHCDYCDRQFVQVANLRRHLRVHTGDKPYACTKCDARFSDSNQLKAHSVTHNFDANAPNGPLTPSTSPVNTKPFTPRLDVVDAMTDIQHATESLYKQYSLPHPQALQQIYENAIERMRSQHQPAGDNMPLDLSLTTTIDTSADKRSRKSHDIRHILRTPGIGIDAAQQIQPEDLRTRPDSPMSEDDDLDDAETLNRKLASNIKLENSE